LAKKTGDLVGTNRAYSNEKSGKNKCGCSAPTTADKVYAKI